MSYQTHVRTADERSLLLYLETCAVDRGGKVDQRRLNDQDRKTLDHWNKTKFVQFGRIAFDYVTEDAQSWCCLSEEAWEIAHDLRKARAERTWKNRKFETTRERNCNV